MTIGPGNPITTKPIKPGKPKQQTGHVNCTIGTVITPDGTSTVVRPASRRFSLEELQKFVGGLIQIVDLGRAHGIMYMNEEGLIHNLKLNQKATKIVRERSPRTLIADGIRGTVVIVQTVKAEGH